MSTPIRFENYELLRNPDGSPLELGRGAMGVTYKARDTDLHCDVALKVINPGILSNPEVRDRFLREARAAARLRHPNIATVFRLGVTPDGTHYYAMEFCDGQTLQQALTGWGSLPAMSAVHLAWQVCKALRLAEEQRLIHRDLKPANLIIVETPDEGLVVKVIDFGLAKSFADGHQTFSTSGAGFAGTAHFASPEQIDERDLDIRSDIYSLGVCLWFMLTGHPPFEGSAARVMSQTLSAELPWDKLTGQPAPVLALLRRMLAKNRDDRPPTAAALRAEMERCMQTLDAPPAEETPTIAAPPAGTEAERLAARFQLGERLGRDALGRVFRATDRENGGTAVTYRVIEPALTAVPATRRELDAQLTAARAHPHPNLVNVLASAVTGQGHIVVTERIEGFTLLELLKHRGAPPPHEVVLLLAPLAAAADHAATHGLRGFSLGKGQTWVHFPDDASAENRQRALAEPIGTWPRHALKIEALSLGGSGGDDDAMQSMATLATSGQGFGLAQRTAPAALAHLASELLGGSGSGTFTPIARLSEDANTILRRACTEPTAFPTATAFLTALRPALGKAPTPASTAPRPTPSRPAPAPIAPPTATRPPARSLAMLAAISLILAVLGLAYYYGIHAPREQARQKREANTEAANKEIAQPIPTAKDEPAKLNVQEMPVTPQTGSQPRNSVAPSEAVNKIALVQFFPAKPDPNKPGAFSFESGSPPLFQVFTCASAEIIKKKDKPNYEGVTVRLTEEDRSRLADLTRQQTGKQLIELHDGEVLMLTNITGEKDDGILQYTSEDPQMQRAIHNMIGHLQRSGILAAPEPALLSFYPIAPNRDEHGAYKVLSGGPPLLEIDNYESAGVIQDTNSPDYRGVELALTDTDAKRLAALAREHEGRLAIFYGKDVVQIANLRATFDRVRLDDRDTSMQIGIRKLAARIAATNQNGTARGAENPEKMVRPFIERHLANLQNHRTDEALGDYAPQVSYFGTEKADHDFIRRSLTMTFEQWPRATEQIVGPISLELGGGLDAWRAKFRTHYRRENKQGGWVEADANQVWVILDPAKHPLIAFQTAQIENNKVGGSSRPLEAPLSPANTVSAPRPEKSWDKPHIYLHIANESQHRAATILKERLAKSGCVVVGIQSVAGNDDIPVQSSELRYFTPYDAVEAKKLAEAIGSFFGSTGIVADLPPGMPAVSHARQYEIWFSNEFRESTNLSSAAATPAGAPTSSEAPRPKTPNPHGVPDGTYYFATKHKSGPHGEDANSNYFVVHGTTYDWFTLYAYTPNDVGRASGKLPQSNKRCLRGTISGNAGGLLNFKSKTIEEINSSPRNDPRNQASLNSLKEQLQGKGWMLRYSDGRLLEDGGSVWTRRE